MGGRLTAEADEGVQGAAVFGEPHAGFVDAHARPAPRLTGVPVLEPGAGVAVPLLLLGPPPGPVEEPDPELGASTCLLSLGVVVEVLDGGEVFERLPAVSLGFAPGLLQAHVPETPDEEVRLEVTDLQAS